MATKCNLIIDSCCDLPYSMVDREGITMVEFPYLFGEEEHFDDLGQTMQPHEFYGRMRNGEHPQTAQVPVTTYTEAFTKLAESGVPAVYLSFSSGLSGSFNVATLVADQVKEQYPDMELHIVDTRLASVAEGLLVYEAMRQRENGLTAAELAAWAEEARNYVNCLFMVDNLEALRRGGRISDTVAYAGTKLDVKPLLTIDLEGKLAMKSVARGRKKGIKALAEHFANYSVIDTFSQLVVTANADSPKDVEKLHDAVLKHRNDTMFLDGSIGPVIGSHVGPDMLALVFWGKDRREEVSVADRIARKIKGE